MTWRPAPEIETANARKWQQAHPDRTRLMTWASNRVCRAMAAGLLVRPSTCSFCGINGFVEAAHKDYNRPLDVIWLCRKCHRKYDDKEPKSLIEPDAYRQVKRYRDRVQLMCDKHRRLEFFGESCSVCGKTSCDHDPSFRWVVCLTTEMTMRQRDLRHRNGSTFTLTKAST